MTYITRTANKKILAKYFLHSLPINYLHWKHSASRSIFSWYATFFTLPITKMKLTGFKEQTRTDPMLDLLSTIHNGWPENKSDTTVGARPFWNYREKITHHNGILFKGNRVIVPASMCTAMLKLIHSSHMGVDHYKRRGRDILFWLGMNAQIEDLVKGCTISSTYKHKNTKEPLLSHCIPSRPWEKVGADLFELNWRHYLILVDYYSYFIEVDGLNETTSQEVLELCKSQIARHGIPNIFISDNGQYQLNLKTSSPYYPQSYGKSEKGVQTIKISCVSPLPKK